MPDTLALEGGKPSVPQDLIAHDWERYRKATDEEVETVAAVLRSGHLSIALPIGMPQSDALGAEFAAWVGVRHGLVVNSGTAALHCAVAGVGVEAGDEVIVPADTFIASAMAVLHHNAIPVFVDVDPDTALIDPALIEAKITPHTRVIMVVHLHGLPADMDPIRAIARRHNLKVIEDSAQTYGGLYKGKKTGALGDAAGFAMTTTKQLMTGEGGLLTTDSDEVYERASMTRLFGEPGSSMTAAKRAYMSERIGWNYKLPETVAALGRLRLKSVQGYVDGCRRNAAYLAQKLEAIPGIKTPVVPTDRTHTYYHFSLQVEAAVLGLDIEAGRLRNGVMKALAAENLDVMQWQSVPVPAQPLFQNRLAYGKGSPWNTHAGEVSYDIEDYPNAFAVLERSFVVRRLVPPNGFEVMDCYARAIQKVYSQIERVVELYDQTDDYVPLEERKAGLAGNSGA